MKNAAVIFKRQITDVCPRGEDGVFACLQIVQNHGYLFSEIRHCLYNSPVETIQTLLENNDNLLVVTERALIQDLTEKLSGVLSMPFTSGSASGAGCFSDSQKTLFLVLSDEAYSGEEYLKNVGIPYLDRKYGARYSHMTVRAVVEETAILERAVEEARRMSGDRLTYLLDGRYGDMVVRIFYDSSVPKMLTDDVMRLLLDRLGDSVYALDDTPIEQRLVQLLKVRGKKISVAESFTGGGVGRRIVSVSGASAVYHEGLNTYAEEAKARRLGVSEYTLKTFGAVSDQTAYEMAAGLLATGQCDVAVATTGLAGPKSDRSELPVGLNYIAVGMGKDVYVYRYRFDGSREEVTEKAVNVALWSAYRLLKTM